MNCAVSAISFNLHCYNQGTTTIRELATTHFPDVFLVQEHWLTPANMVQLESFYGYFVVGSSAICQAVDAGVPPCRSYGGVAALIKNSLLHVTTTSISTERFCIIKIFDWLLCSIYFPCSGSPDRSIM